MSDEFPRFELVDPPSKETTNRLIALIESLTKNGIFLSRSGVASQIKTLEVGERVIQVEKVIDITTQQKKEFGAPIAFIANKDVNNDKSPQYIYMITEEEAGPTITRVELPFYKNEPRSIEETVVQLSEIFTAGLNAKKLSEQEAKGLVTFLQTFQ